MSEVNMWEIEQSWMEKGYEIICGVDEADRGPSGSDGCLIKQQVQL